MYKKVILEFLTNIISFSLLIVVQQIIALPIISRSYNVDVFGKVILAFGISNIITSIFGFSIGNARLLDNKFYNYTYLKLLIQTNFIAFIIGFFAYIVIFPNMYFEAFIYSLVCVLGSIRFFFISEYRIKDDHSWILKQNSAYFAGILLGLLIFYFQRNWIIVFFTAETVAVLITYCLFLYRKKFLSSFRDTSRLSYTNTLQLMINNGISYSLSQYDRFIIYPILGAANVSLYYSTSISARVGSLIMNPLSNFILGKLAKKKAGINKNAIIFVIVISVIVSIAYFFLTILTTPILVKILYPSFFLDIKQLILPICLGTAFMGGVSVLKPVTMKYMGVKYFNKLFLFYGILLVILSITFSLKGGLIGVAFANVISSATLFVYLLFSLCLSSRKWE